MPTVEEVPLKARAEGRVIREVDALPIKPPANVATAAMPNGQPCITCRYYQYEIAISRFDYCHHPKAAWTYTPRPDSVTGRQEPAEHFTRSACRRVRGSYGPCQLWEWEGLGRDAPRSRHHPSEAALLVIGGPAVILLLVGLLRMLITALALMVSTPAIASTTYELEPYRRAIMRLWERRPAPRQYQAPGRRNPAIRLPYRGRPAPTTPPRAKP